MKTEYTRADITGRQHVYIVMAKVIFADNHRQIIVTEMVRHPAARPWGDDDRFVGTSIYAVPFRADLQPGDELVGISSDGFGMKQICRFADRQGRYFGIETAIGPGYSRAWHEA